MGNVSHFETEELIRAMFNLGDDAEYDEIEDVLLKNLDVDFEQFYNCVNALIRHTPVIASNFHDYNLHAFVEHKGNGLMLAHVKLKSEV